MSARDEYRLVLRDLVEDPQIAWHACSQMLDEVDQLRALVADLWDEVMAWHYDDCPFPDSTMGTPDAECICHRDLLATYTKVVEP